MGDDLNSLLDRLQGVTSREALQAEIARLRDHFEVEHLVYHSVSGAGEQYAALTYSQDWVSHYVSQGYARIDPVVRGCLRSFEPVDWRALDWTGRQVTGFLDEALDAGVGRQGLSVPIRGPGGQFALFSVSDRRQDVLWQAHMGRSQRDLLLAAHFVNQRALEIDGRTTLCARALSPREIDALTMLAVGMNRPQAAERLAISEHTLRVYIESARAKLGALNTTHAVASALSQGLLLP
ncbi:MAG: LuxR family transcriptional regulator [Rhodobacteraceae bacterium]|nr:LuxR family transcriptional regulator [Paracoccaceae bacterium]